MGRQTQQSNSFLRSLLRDPTANTIVIAAASLVPLMAMVGGGVDAGRYYMAASRLQAACDAGALAARRAMTTSAFTTTHRTIAHNFFDHNFPDGLYGSTGRTRSYAANTQGVVTGTASAVIPATIMRTFGYESFNISASCSADINIANTDIVFALDVTGSMNCPDNNFTSCPSGNNNNVEASNSRIQGLRTATLNFYDTVVASTSGSAQVRFGFVPYSHNVNVLNVIPRTHLASSHAYQSRRWIDEFISDQEEWIPRDLNNFPNPTESQQRYNNNSNGTVNTADRDRCQITNRGTFRVGEIIYEISNNEYRLNVFSGGSTATNRAGCRANVRRTRRVYSYEQRTFDVSGIRNGGTVTTDTGVNGANVTHTWNGCIEEAATVNTGTWNPMPTAAHDMNINLVPTTEAQRWKPSLPDVVFRRTSNGSPTGTPTTATVRTHNELNNSLSYTCPAASRRLGDITRAQLQTYLNNLQAIGATYHAMGMVWAGRIISPNGLFAADNTTAPNGDPITRHVVFMTDGLANETHVQTYNPWGMELWDRRTTGAGDQTESHDRHAARLQAVCTALKRENISVWVVVLNPTLTQNMIDCASPGRAYRATNATELNTAFQEIAQKIAALRLTQ